MARWKATPEKKEYNAMAKTVTASMTDGQINSLIDKIRAAVRKHRSEFDSKVVQQVLGVENLGMRLLEPFRKLVEVASSIIVRHVKTDRTLTPQQVLDATGRKQYTNKFVVEAMPRGEEDEGDICFFQLDLSARGGHISDDDLDKEFWSNGFKPADPYKLAQANADDPAFADEHLNCTHWQDANGEWCYAAFGRWNDERNAGVNRDDNDWNDN